MILIRYVARCVSTSKGYILKKLNWQSEPFDPVVISYDSLSINAEVSMDIDAVDWEYYNGDGELVYAKESYHDTSIR